MNFSTIEDVMSEEKNKYSNFFSRFYNARILVFIFFAIIITVISLSVWFRSSKYQILYNHLSNDDRVAIINQLDEMKVPYQFSESSGQLLVPEDKIYALRLYLSENNLPRSGNIGFELIDQAKFGSSQFNENINYQRALEGELSRTIQRINIIKSARIHLALPKSSVFIEESQKPSAAIILDIKQGFLLHANQINAILHLVSSSISNLSVNNITIVDQFGRLLNNLDVDDDQSSSIKFQYSQKIEEHFQKRIQDILEPFLGKGHVYAQVTAQIDFNSRERTEEKYEPNSNLNNQSVRSYQMNIHDEASKKNITYKNNFHAVPLNKIKNTKLKIDKEKKVINDNQFSKRNSFLDVFPDLKKSNINHENTVNYELNRTILHTKMNTGNIKRLSAAVVINFVDKNGILIHLSAKERHNIENLVREAIGFSKNRGDSISIVNTSFKQNNVKHLIKNRIVKKTHYFNDCVTILPFFLIFLFFLNMCKKIFCPVSKNTSSSISDKKEKQEKIDSNIHDQNNLEEKTNINQLVNKICNISNQNPRTMALIIRKWMSEKK